MYPLRFSDGWWTEEDRRELRAGALEELTEKWEAILRDEPDPFRLCQWCGSPVGRQKPGGKPKWYCTSRCQRAAHRALKDVEPDGGWMPRTTVAELQAAGLDDRYIDAVPGDHPPLNKPVLPREGETFERDVIGQFDRGPWAWEILGAAA